MKKVGIFLIMIIALIGVGSGLNINSSKNVYQPGETAVVSFKGNFYETLSVDNVEIKRNNVIVPAELVLQKFDNEYDVVFVTPTGINNYTLWIKDLAYIDKGVQVKKDEGFNFSTNGSVKDYYVRPSTLNPKQEFFVVVYSNLDDVTSINVDFPNIKSETIKPGENKVYFPVNTIYGSKRINITIGEYVIPFLISGNLSENDVVKNTYGFYASPSEIDKIVNRTTNLSYSFSLINSGNSDLEGINISYDSDKIYLSPSETLDLNSGESKNFTVSLKKLEDYSGEIRFDYSNSTMRFKINFDARESASNSSVNGTILPSNQYFCEELRGVICQAGEECSGESKDSINGPCCMAACKESSSGGGLGILGWIIILIVLGAIGFLAWKYRKVPKQENGALGQIINRPKIEPRKAMP